MRDWPRHNAYEAKEKVESNGENVGQRDAVREGAVPHHHGVVVEAIKQVRKRHETLRRGTEGSQVTTNNNDNKKDLSITVVVISLKRNQSHSLWAKLKSCQLQPFNFLR